MFESLAIHEVRPIVWLKRVFRFVIVVFLAIGMVSSHRAYIQVRNLELKAPHTLSAGSNIEIAVLTSGRTTVDVDVDLIQGARSERLFRLHVPGSELAFFDPRTRNGSQLITLTAEQLSKFQTGAAR